MNAQPQEEQLTALLDYLQRARGFDFRGYKRASVTRRIEKRLQAVGVSTFEEYIDYLEVHPEEFSQLFNTLLINVTAFFRDSLAWEYLAQEIIPRIIAAKPPEIPIRIWSAGCSSGEEAYTLAMVLIETLGKEAFRQRVKIYATDIDEEALIQARQATYSPQDLQPIPAELQERYFEGVGSRFVFRPELRRVVIFGRHDLLTDAPISRLDLIVCRNTLMYFNAETQARVLARFHFALNDQGILFLGRAEMLLTHAHLFAPLELKHRVFKKVPLGDNLRDRLLLRAQAGQPDANNHLGRQSRLRELAFDSSPVAQVVFDLNGNLALANTQARTFFGVDSKDIGRPFQDLDLSYRPVELRSLVEEATTQRHALTRADVACLQSDGETKYLEIEVRPLQEHDIVSAGFSITFRDVTQAHLLQEDLQRFKQEVETANEELQSTNEELETTNEELQSTNEELETTNEELQSTNEEMETMNEELQSTNAEMQAVNDELRSRTVELHTANAFLQAILTSLQAGVAVVDRTLNVLSWSPRAEDLWGLRSEEVIGRSFFSLDSGLPVEHLREALRLCLAGEKGYHELTVVATTRRGKSIRCRITCSTLKTPEDEIQGVIVLMEESTP